MCVSKWRDSQRVSLKTPSYVEVNNIVQTNREKSLMIEARLTRMRMEIGTGKCNRVKEREKERENRRRRRMGKEGGGERIKREL